jgi:HEAT repeat protein
MAVGPEDIRADGGMGVAQAELDPIERLRTFLKVGRGRFRLGALSYDLPGQRDEILVQLRERLPDWNLVAVSLQDRALDLHNLSARLIETLGEIATAAAGGRAPDAVLLLDWDQRLVRDLPGDRQPPSALVGVLNLGREVFRQQFACPVVIVLPNWALAKIKETAVDLDSWISGSFYFPCDPGRVEARLAAVLEDTAKVRSRGDIPRALDRLWAGLTDAEALHRIHPVPELVSRFLHRLGELYLATGEKTQAEVQFERLERWARQHGLDEWAAKAERGVEAARRMRAKMPEPEIPVGSDFWEIFRGPASLTEADRLVGREDDLTRVCDMVQHRDFRMGTLWGEPGCGKTSLVRAGLIPSLRRQGYVPVYLSRYGEAEEDIRRALAESSELGSLPGGVVEAFQDVHARTGRSLILICDQFEQVFKDDSPDGRKRRAAFLGALAKVAKSPTLPLRCLLLVRADQLFRLAVFDRLLSSPLHPMEAANRYELRFLREADAARILSQIGEKGGLNWPAELISEVIRDLARDQAELTGEANRDGTADKRVKPVEIQLVAASLYLRKVKTLADYEAIGGVSNLLRDYLNAVFGTLPFRQVEVRRVVRSLVSPGAPVRRESLTVEEVAHRAGVPVTKAETMLESLVGPHIVQPVPDTDPPRFELVHDVLAEPALQAASPQEVGLGIITTALAEGSDLGARDLWAALRCSLEPLPSAQHKRAVRLRVRSAAKLLAELAGVAAVLLIVLAAWLQLRNTFVHQVGRPPSSLIVYQGIPALKSLGGTELFDTGIPFDDILPEKLDKLHGLRTIRRDAQFTRGRAFDPGTEDLLDCLRPRAKVRWRCYLGDWDGGIRSFRDQGVSLDDADWKRVIAFAPPAALKPLYSMLEDDRPVVREAAAWAVGMLGETDAAEPTERLARLLADNNPGVRDTTIAAMAKLSKVQKQATIRTLALLRMDRAARSAAILALGRILEDEPVRLVAELLPAIKETDLHSRGEIEGPESYQVQSAVKQALFGVRPQAGPADAALRLWAEDLARELDKLRVKPLRDSAVARLALVAIASALSPERVRGMAEELVAALREELPWPDRPGGIGEVPWAPPLPPGYVPDGPFLKSELLARLAVANPENTLPAIAKGLGDQNDNMKSLLLDSLYRLFSDPALSQRPENVKRNFGDDACRSIVRDGFVIALRLYDGLPKAAILVGALGLPSDEVAEHLARLILRLIGAFHGDWRFIAFLDQHTRDLIIDRAGKQLGSGSSVRERWNALVILHAFGKEIPAARGIELIDRIRPLLRDADEDNKREAASALVELATEDSPLIEDFLSLLTDPKTDPNVRLSAISGLGKVGAPKAKEVIRAILPIVESEIRGTNVEHFQHGMGYRDAAATALKSLAARAPDAVISAILPHVARDDDAMQLWTLQVLTMVVADHPLPDDDFDVLKWAAHDNDRRVRDASESALGEAEIWKVLGESNVSGALVEKLKSEQSARDSSYRRVITQALVRWYIDGLVFFPKQQPPDARAGKARAEHERLFAALSAPCQDERIWLRHAACDAYGEMNAIKRGIRSHERGKVEPRRE